MPLDPKLIEQLVLQKSRSVGKTKTPQTRPSERPMQIGPLRWFDEIRRCAQRGCGTACYCAVNGVPYCMNHALTKLNALLIEAPLEICECNAGKYSNGNIHTSDCPLYKQLKQEQESANVG